MTPHDARVPGGPARVYVRRVEIACVVVDGLTGTQLGVYVDRDRADAHAARENARLAAWYAADPYCDGCDAPGVDVDRPWSCATCGGRIMRDVER